MTFPGWLIVSGFGAALLALGVGMASLGTLGIVGGVLDVAAIGGAAAYLKLRH